MSKFLAAAKINLALHITGRREDGYHLLDSLVAFAEYGDRIEVVADDHISLTIDGPFAGCLPDSETNQVMKAARALAMTARSKHHQHRGARISLCKNLPVTSGIGGGSADAAACLLALCDLWNLSPVEVDLPKIAHSLGADVAMCLRSNSLIARGIGNDIATTALPRLHMVLANPGRKLSTRKVFANLARYQNPPLPELPVDANAGQLIEWLTTVRNDLETPAIGLEPLVGSVLAALTASRHCLLARMSGSGATCFGLFASSRLAEEATVELSRRFPDWWCIATQTR